MEFVELATKTNTKDYNDKKYNDGNDNANNNKKKMMMIKIIRIKK